MFFPHVSVTSTSILTRDITVITVYYVWKIVIGEQWIV